MIKKFFDCLPIGNCAAVMAAVVMMAGSVQADQVTWGSSFVFDDATDVINNGNVIKAASRWDVTVNGVSFATEDMSAWGFTNGNGSTFGVGTFTAATGDADLDLLNTSHMWVAGGVNEATITVDGLEAGKDYQFQYFVVDDRSCCAGRSHVLGDPDGGTPSGEVLRGGAGDGTSGGNSVLGTWSATSTTQDITVTTTDGNGAIAGYIVSEVSAVPEPGSLMFLGLGMAGLALSRRRK